MTWDSYGWVQLCSWTHFNEITGWRPSFKLKADVWPQRLPSLLLRLNPIYMRRVGVWCFVTLHLRPLRWLFFIPIHFSNSITQQESLLFNFSKRSMQFVRRIQFFIWQINGLSWIFVIGSAAMLHMVYCYVTLLAVTLAMLAYTNTFTLFPKQTDLFLHSICVKIKVGYIHLTFLTNSHFSSSAGVTSFSF